MYELRRMVLREFQGRINLFLSQKPELDKPTEVREGIKITGELGKNTLLLIICRQLWKLDVQAEKWIEKVKDPILQVIKLEGGDFTFINHFIEQHLTTRKIVIPVKIKPNKIRKPARRITTSLAA